MRRVLWILIVLTAVGLLAGTPTAGAGGGDEAPTTDCTKPVAAHEPPCNPALPDSPWSVSHRGSYAQASSAWAGPVADDEVEPRHVVVPGVPIQLQFTEPYDDGGIAVWGSLVNTADDRGVIKLDHDTGEVIDVYLPAEREADPPEPAAGGITGAYSILDRDGRLIVGRQRSFEVYEDEVLGDRHSPIRLVTRFEMPEEAFCRDDDVLVGATMTYSGEVAFATEQGVIGVLPRDPDAMSPDSVTTTSLNGEACDDTSVAGEDLETVSNSLAADEDGGIYVVTSRRMYRIDSEEQTDRLEVTWSAPYEAGGEAAAIRLGEGSGSTPSLMGTAEDDDRFVVITDGQDLMHVVLLWRDEIPEGWEPVRPGADQRIACEFPVTFGDPDAEASLSEQSVLVRGQATVHVNNRITDDSITEGLPPALASARAALEGGDPAQAPSGIERIDWDPEEQACHSVWAGSDISIPNGIPTMSEATRLFYGVGLRDGRWGIEAVDFDTGDSRAWFPAANEPCAEEALDGVEPAQRAALEEIVSRLPNSCENSVYAATEVGPDGTIYTGTLFGVTSHVPTDPPPPPAVAAADTEPGADGDGDGSPWWPWVVGALAAVLIWLSWLIPRRRKVSSSR